ncbi:tetratricopeptide repeat protein [Granulicella arctica]|uniref:tetratricopeptide repeat protein n=1 Tax=Granulicella arctica TaxID=940613 RepID=UPI0021E098E2|nr:hypothetical protein [Granulicella arctica]
MLIAVSGFAQQAPPLPQDAVAAAGKTAATEYAAKREAALAPVFQFISLNDYASALAAVRPVLAAYPRDFRVLFLAADATRVTGDFAGALALYQQCLALNTLYVGSIHLGMARTYAGMNQWAEFNRERVIVQKIALTGDPNLSLERGYVVEDYRSGTLHIEILEFAASGPAATTRFRFLFTNSFDKAARFTPSIDLEANPADATSFAHQFPYQAAAHIRPFALAEYPNMRSRTFLKFYPDGEPPYEDVRRDVLALAASFPGKVPVGEKAAGEYRPPYQPKPAQTPKP